MPQYTTYQPRPYRPRMSAYWYLDQFHYLRYAMRESSSFFVAYFAVVTLVQIAALNAGPTRYAHFQAVMQCPWVIVLNAIALGLMANTGERMGDSPMLQRIFGTIPMGRLGQPREIGACAVWLASEQAAYVTGQTIHINGGSVHGR